MIGCSPTIGPIFIRSETIVEVNFEYIYCIICVYLNTQASHELRTRNAETTYVKRIYIKQGIYK